jgi:hypothetical protein
MSTNEVRSDDRQWRVDMKPEVVVIPNLGCRRRSSQGGSRGLTPLRQR